MNLRWLETLQAVMTLGTVTKAAEHVHVTQPAASRMLANLEAELGFKLFMRSQGRLTPTTECQRFYREVERLLVGVGDILSVANDIRDRRGPRLRIVAMASIAETLLPKVLSRFKREHPDLQVSIDIRGRRDIEQGMASQQFDIGIAALPIEHEGIRIHPFIEADILAILPPGHPLAEKTTLKPTDLRNESFIGLRYPGALRHQIDHAMRDIAGSHRVVIETTSMNLACKMVSEGLGITIADIFSFDTQNSKRFICRSLDSKIRRAYGFVYPSSRPQSKLTLKFADAMQTTARNYAKHVRGKLTAI